MYVCMVLCNTITTETNVSKFLSCTSPCQLLPKPSDTAGQHQLSDTGLKERCTLNIIIESKSVRRNLACRCSLNVLANPCCNGYGVIEPNKVYQFKLSLTN